MAIIGLQKRLREGGRIRIGQQVKTAKGTRPASLDAFRFTSPSERAITEIARLYGGEPHIWENAPAGTGTQWEVFSVKNVIPILLPPSGFGLTQWFEEWSAGGCKKRCDGETETITDTPCSCDEYERICKPHSRLNVILAELDSVSLFRLETQGYNAASELAGAVDMIENLAGKGKIVPARLVLIRRSSIRPGEPRRDFVVPGIDFDAGIRKMMTVGGEAVALSSANHVEPSEPKILTPIKQPELTVKEQVEAEPKPKRQSKALGVKSTGLEPVPVGGIVTKPQIAIIGEADEPKPERLEPTVYTISDAQMRKLQVLFKDLGITDREDRLAVAATRLNLNNLDSFKDLTVAQASELIDDLDHYAQSIEGADNEIE